MKDLLSLLVLVMLVTTVLVTGSVQPGAGQSAGATGSSDPVSRIIAGIAGGMSHPLTSVCTSPAFTLYERLVNPDAGSNDLDHCVQFFAVQAGDTSQCAGIQRGAPRTKCYCLIASRKNDPGICDQVPLTDDVQAYLKIDCLWEVAIKNNNADACRQMGNDRISRMFIGEMSRQTCLARLASGQGVGESTL